MSNMEYTHVIILEGGYTINITEKQYEDILEKITSSIDFIKIGETVIHLRKIIYITEIGEPLFPQLKKTKESKK